MDFGISSVKDLAELLSYLVVILGIPVAVWQYVRVVRKEQRERETATYNAVDDKYIEFQRLCLEYPRLDVWDLPNASPVELNAEEKKQELIAFTYLLAIFERGFLVRSDMSPEQWTGWLKYMEDYSRRPNFRHAWRQSSGTFDQRFEDFMGRLVADNDHEAEPSPPAYPKERADAPSGAALRRVTFALKNERTHFQPIHRYELHENGVTDRATLDFASDTIAMYRSMYQGMAPAGEWIQTRVATLVRGWLPDWEISHGQIADFSNPSIQSRSWDLVIHRAIPEAWGFPPPASPSGPWPLIPKELCCAVVDTKGRYNTPQDYAKKKVFNLDLTGDLPQLEFLRPEIVPILFIVASTYSPDTVEAAGLDCHLRTFVIAKAIDGTTTVDWHLNTGRDSKPPLTEFRQLLLEAVAQWHSRNEPEELGEQGKSTVSDG